MGWICVCQSECTSRHIQSTEMRCKRMLGTHASVSGFKVPCAKKNVYDKNTSGFQSQLMYSGWFFSKIHNHCDQIVCNKIALCCVSKVYVPYAINIRIINKRHMLCILFIFAPLDAFPNLNDRHSGIYSKCNECDTLASCYMKTNFLRMHLFHCFNFDGVCFPKHLSHLAEQKTQ